jgi:hypothetical protein
MPAHLFVTPRALGLPAPQLTFLLARALVLLRNGAAPLCEGEEPAASVLADLAGALNAHPHPPADLVAILADALGSPRTLAGWRLAIGETANRIALAATGDLYAALGALAQLEPEPDGWRDSAAARLQTGALADLVRFAVEPVYAEAVRTTGHTPGPGAPR